MVKLIKTGLVATVLLTGGLGLSACASHKYVDERIAAANARIDGVDAKATDAIGRADAAAQSANAANGAAQAAAAAAATANQRLDQLTPRVDSLEQRAMEQQAPKAPRN